MSQLFSSNLARLSAEIESLTPYLKKVSRAWGGGMTYLLQDWDRVHEVLDRASVEYSHAVTLVDSIYYQMHCICESDNFAKEFFNLDKNTQLKILSFSEKSYLMVRTRVELDNFKFNLFSPSVDLESYHTQFQIDKCLMALWQSQSIFAPPNLQALQESWAETCTYFNYLKESSAKETLKLKFEQLIKNDFPNFISCPQNTLSQLYPNMLSIIGMKLLNTPAYNLGATKFFINNELSLEKMEGVIKAQNQYLLFDPASNLFSRDLSFFEFLSHAERDIAPQLQIIKDKAALEGKIEENFRSIEKLKL